MLLQSGKDRHTGHNPDTVPLSESMPQTAHKPHHLSPSPHVLMARKMHCACTRCTAVAHGLTVSMPGAEHTAPASAVLDFGLLTDAIHVSTGAHLEFQRLHVPNSGNRKLRHPSQHTRLHVAGAFALWPSVTLAQGSRVRQTSEPPAAISWAMLAICSTALHVHIVSLQWPRCGHATRLLGALLAGLAPCAGVFQWLPVGPTAALCWAMRGVLRP